MLGRRGDPDRCGIADAPDGVVKGIPVSRTRPTRIRERDVFHWTIGRLDGPCLRIVQTTSLGDGELKLRRPAAAVAVEGARKEAAVRTAAARTIDGLMTINISVFCFIFSLRLDCLLPTESFLSDPSDGLVADDF